MKCIVAVDANWGIGKNGDLLAHIGEDMQFFRKMTMGHIIVMGRKTLDSFPGGRALEGRRNIVLTKNPSFERKNVECFTDVDAVLDALKDVPSEEIFVIGGESIYRQFLPYCDTAYVTKIDYAYDADSYFPNLNTLSEWKMVYESEEKTSFDLIYTFTTYEKDIQ